jgi:dTDP-4-dehydrorhamnose reductase
MVLVFSGPVLLVDYAMRHVVIIGARGQLAADLQPALRGVRVTGLTHVDVDVCDPARTRAVVGNLRPDVLINTSAFQNVDLCEDEPALAFAVNAIAVHGLAQLARALDCTLIHFSTDYIFDGRARSPYTEQALPNPLSVYGASKLAGEHLMRNFCPRHFLIRTGGLYGVAGSRSKGGNFVETMIRLGKSGDPVRVVDDQVVTPTATADLAAAIATLVEREGRVPYGLYHVTNAGQCSWHEFAKTIFELCGMRVDVSAVTTREWGAKAARPAFSVLNHSHWVEVGFEAPRPWREALRDYLRTTGRIPT